MALTPQHVFVVNGRKHFPAGRVYIEKLNDQSILRVRNAKAGLFLLLDPESMRQLAGALSALADDAEASAAALADEAIKKAMGQS